MNVEVCFDGINLHLYSIGGEFDITINRGEDGYYIQACDDREDPPVEWVEELPSSPFLDLLWDRAVEEYAIEEKRRKIVKRLQGKLTMAERDALGIG